MTKTTTLADLFDAHEAEQEAKPAPAPKPSAHGLTPLVDATFAKYQADRQAMIETVPLEGRAWKKRSFAAIQAACAGLDAAYQAFLQTPEAQAELAALRAYEESLPDEVEVEETDDEDEDEEEDR